MRRILAPIEWNVPSHGIACSEPVNSADALAHLARRLVGEGDGEDFVGARAAGGDEMGDAGGQHPRLADARAGQHEHRPVQRLDRAPLLVVQAVEIARPRAGGGRERARGDGASRAGDCGGIERRVTDRFMSGAARNPKCVRRVAGRSVHRRRSPQGAVGFDVSADAVAIGEPGSRPGDQPFCRWSGSRMSH